MDHKKVMEALSADHQKELEAAGINISSLVQLLLQHGCDAAPAIRALIPVLPISLPVQAAIIGVVNIVCPA